MPAQLGVILLAAALVQPPPLAHPAFPDFERRGCTEPLYTRREEIPEFWDGIGDALRRTGISRRVKAACYRATGVWTAWVLTEAPAGVPLCGLSSDTTWEG